MLPPKGWIAILVLIVLAGLYGAHRGIVAYEVDAAVQKTTVSLNSEYDKKLKAAELKTAKTEDELRLNALQATRDKNAQIAILTTSLNDALKRLRDRQERPPAQPSGEVASSGGSCTARELYREDAEFLTREAYRAQSVIVERDYYYNQYEQARKKLDGY